MAAAPKNAAVQDTYGWILLGTGKAPEAVALLEQAARSLPQDSSVQYHYAAALIDVGRPREARPLLKEALKGRLPEAERTAASEMLRQVSSADSNKQ